MAKPELGTKRQCPKCGTRFYDLGKSDPITCINCGQNFLPETILKPRRPTAEPVEEKIVKKPDPEVDVDDILEDDVDVDVDVESDADEDK